MAKFGEVLAVRFARFSRHKFSRTRPAEATPPQRFAPAYLDRTRPRGGRCLCCNALVRRMTVCICLIPVIIYTGRARAAVLTGLTLYAAAIIIDAASMSQYLDSMRRALVQGAKILPASMAEPCLRVKSLSIQWMPGLCLRFAPPGLQGCGRS